jgi:hypothetical protein
MKGEAMSSLYLPPPEYIEYLVDRRPARKPEEAAAPAKPARPLVGIASDAEGPRIRRWIVIG